MTKLTNSVYAIEVPEGAKISDVTKWSLYYYLDGKQYLISLPPGNWRVLCTTREATDKDTICLEGESIIGLSTLPDLITSKGLDGNKNYCLIEKL